MSETQNIEYRLRTGGTKYIDKIICQIFDNIFNNNKFSEDITKNIVDKFLKDIVDITESAFHELIKVENYEEDIKEKIVDILRDYHNTKINEPRQPENA